MYIKREEKKKAKKLLKKHSQKEVAKLLGVTEKTISCWVKQFRVEETTEKKERDILIDEIKSLITEIREFRNEFSKSKNK